MATKIRNTSKNFTVPSFPIPPQEYSASFEAQRDTVFRLYFQGIDEALKKALQYDSSDIIDGSIPDSKLEARYLRKDQNDTTEYTLTVGGLIVDTDTLYVDAVNNRVGILTTTPSEVLDVVGNVQATEFIGDLRGAVVFKAKAGEDLTKGDVVYISGISGNTTVVSKADANDSAKMPAFGLAATTVSNNANLEVYTFGTLSGIDTSSYSEGDELFVSDTAGQLTATAPTGESSAVQKIAKVTRSHASAGSVKIMGAGRTNATPNLNDGNIFMGNASNITTTVSFDTKVGDYITANPITNAQLAGSIENSKLVNDSVSYGGVSLDLGQSDATPAFNLSDATNYPTSSLSGTIATAQIADDAVTQAKIADNAIGSDQIASGAVIAGKLQTNAVATSNIQTDAITTVKITDANVTTAKIADDAVTTAKIADDAVTDAKLADSINSAITANTAKVTNATHTGEVTGATALTIADNVVDEANLKVSNAPVNGYFLSAQSGNTGGLTWAQVSGGIAAVVDDTTPQLGGNLDAQDKEIQDVKELGIGFSGSPSYKLQLEDAKGATSTELVRIKETGSHYGRIINFYKSSNRHGSIGLSSVAYGQGIYSASQVGGLKFQNQFTTVVVEPCDGDGGDKDNSIDLGRSSNRFDDIYATNATIQTSDRSLKQDIEELSDAERRVAVAAKGLLRKFRWIDSVAEKGDSARIHFGIIAQDLESAFTAEGLDAGKYAMFISTTWWEHEGEKYYEQAHIPEGVTATEVTRRGVRYPELLAFIIASL